MQMRTAVLVSVSLCSCSPSVQDSPQLSTQRSELSSPTGSMIDSRGNFPLITLPSGQVLASSGVAGIDGPLGNSELHNATTGTWSATGAMNVGRTYHSGVLLPDGRVLISGGAGSPSGGFAISIPDELYAPATATWTLAGSGYARSHGATLVHTNGSVLEVGGVISNTPQWLSYARLFNPTTGVYTGTGALLTARSSFGTVLLPSGKVLVVGGQGSTGYAIASAEIYDPTSGIWSAAAPALHADSTATLTLLPDGTVLWAGGSSTAVDRYNPATNTWSAFATLPQPRAQAGAAVIGTGLYLLGGYTTDVTATTVRVDLGTGAVAASDPLVVARLGFAMATLQNGNRLIASGSTAEIHSICVPTTCAAQNATCGTISDGCGTNLSCGTCSGGLSCSASHQCVDSTPPMSAIAAPNEGDVVHGAVAVTALASDNVGVTRVDFYDGATVLGLVASPPYTVIWNTVGAGEGTHALTAVARDAAGNTATSVARHVTVSNAPSVSVAAPVDGSSVAGIVTLSANATALDGRIIAVVDYFVDGSYVGSGSAPPGFAFNWQSRAVTNGSHVLTARATDSGGFVATSAGTNVTTNNDLTPPTVAVTAPTTGAVVRGAISLAVSTSDKRRGGDS